MDIYDAFRANIDALHTMKLEVGIGEQFFTYKTKHDLINYISEELSLDSDTENYATLLRVGCKGLNDYTDMELALKAKDIIFSYGGLDADDLGRVFTPVAQEIELEINKMLNNAVETSILK